ncbi:hypothetical protein DUNSADRAFT_442 [Dunaliella salina]|uniref:Encoded protein n=1 Tax=Dunaliella salina TaxID=3046 RepID=A0ABQ7GY87_DUNSA|nr:hypothetical protein DUNSADRAFT_442 [Dunaliella salina]|eukprot:KAF5839567.1 hypothetical protein DUNSADRAFT_442 [Dunaliella salina]
METKQSGQASPNQQEWHNGMAPASAFSDLTRQQKQIKLTAWIRFKPFGSIGVRCWLHCQYKEVMHKVKFPNVMISTKRSFVYLVKRW